MSPAAPSVDFDRVAEAVSPAQLAEAIGARKAKGGGNYHCPNGAGHSNGDRNPSLSIDRREGRTVAFCHGCGLSGSPVQVAAELWRVDRHEAAQQLAGSIGIQPATNGKHRSEIVAEYDYVDEDSELLYQVVRLEPKSFRQRRPDGSGGWDWSTKGVRRVLYRLPEIIEAVALGKLIHVVEGEKDVHAIEQAGGIATTNPGGSGGWREEYRETLRGARVRIVADKDEAGREHARTLAESLEEVAASVEIVEAREGKDPHDHVQAGHGLEDFVPMEGKDGGEDDEEKAFPKPRTVAEIMAEPEPEEEAIAQGIIRTAENILVAGYPKTFKTMVVEDLTVAASTGTPFLHHFQTTGPHRVGLVLMEGGERRNARRLERLAFGRGLTADDLDRVHIWYRPPLRFTDLGVMRELTEWAQDLALDLLAVDAWAYVSDGDSDDADVVTPQLMAFSSIRETCPGLTTLLVHHARKTMGDNNADRLTDLIRNSGAFGAWFDAGLALSRKDEHSPVKVRTEFRDHPPLDPFAFTVEDEEPAYPANDFTPQGWLRMEVSEDTPETVDRKAQAERMVRPVVEFLRDHPGASTRQVTDGVTGRARDIREALDLLVEKGRVRREDGKRNAVLHYLVEGAE